MNISEEIEMFKKFLNDFYNILPDKKYGFKPILQYKFNNLEMAFNTIIWNTNLNQFFGLNLQLIELKGEHKTLKLSLYCDYRPDKLYKFLTCFLYSSRGGVYTQRIPVDVYTLRILNNYLIPKRNIDRYLKLFIYLMRKHDPTYYERYDEILLEIL